MVNVKYPVFMFNQKNVKYPVFKRWMQYIWHCVEVRQEEKDEDFCDALDHVIRDIGKVHCKPCSSTRYGCNYCSVYAGLEHFNMCWDEAEAAREAEIKAEKEAEAERELERR
jgi:hypothetical protein